MRIGDNLWAHIQKDANGCWNWNKSVNNTGYGHLTVNGKTITAHRMAWILTHGEIPENLCVLHKCDNRKCINPDHLFLGTKKDNTHDAINKGRFVRTKKEQKARGEKHGLTKLSDDQVAKIHHEYWSHEKTTTELAKTFGVCVQTISNIIHGKTWSHVTGEKS